MPQDREAVDAEKQPSNLFSSNEELIERAGSLSFLVAGEAIYHRGPGNHGQVLSESALSL